MGRGCVDALSFALPFLKLGKLGLVCLLQRHDDMSRLEFWVQQILWSYFQGFGKIDTG